MEGRKTTVRVGRATRNPNRILASDAYWNVPFLKRYLDRCDEIGVHEPKKAYEMAEPLVTLADARIFVGGREGAYKSVEERRSYRVHARIVRALTAKRICEYGEAETIYAEAFKLAEKPMDTSIKARLHTCYAWLLVEQGNPRAVSEGKSALELEADTVTIAAAVMVRGVAAFQFEDNSGLEFFAHAAALAKTERTTKRGQRVFYAALHGVAKALSDCHPMPNAQTKAYQLLNEVKSHLAGRPKSVAKMLVYRQMGRIAWNLGYNRYGPRLLIKARNGFRDLGNPSEFALCSLDLAGIYLEGGELPEYDALAADTVSYIETLDSPELLEALSAWSEIDVHGATRKVKAKLKAVCQAVETLKDGEK